MPRLETRVLQICYSNYGKDADKRRSITGYVFTLHGCAICSLQLLFHLLRQSIWRLQKQLRKIYGWGGVFSELNDILKVTMVFWDNQSVIS